SMNGDPVLTLMEGWRYEFNNTVSAGHPFEFISEGAMVPDDDTIQLSETTGGALAADMSIGWSAGGGTIQFTVSPAFTGAVGRYRCLIHRTDMRGSVQYMMP